MVLQSSLYVFGCTDVGEGGFENRNVAVCDCWVQQVLICFAGLLKDIERDAPPLLTSLPDF